MNLTNPKGSAQLQALSREALFLSCRIENFYFTVQLLSTSNHKIKMAILPFPFGALNTALSLLLMHGISVTMFRCKYDDFLMASIRSGRLSRSSLMNGTFW